MSKSLYYFLIFYLLLSAVSCDSRDDINEPEEKQMVNISVRLSEAVGGNKAKALTLADENTIGQIDLLVFNKNGNNYEYAYHTKGSRFTYSSDNVGKFTAYLKPGTQALVIIANAEEEVFNAISHIGQGEDINTALPKITVQTMDKWDIDTPRLIPMYCNIETTITSSTTEISPSEAYFVRMLAKIDISNTDTNFELTDAFLFKPVNKGRITYSGNNWNAVDLKVNNAEIPADARQIAIPFEYSILSNNLTHSAYTFESSAVTDPKNATAVVIGGYYDYPQNSTVKSYYRVDIPVTETGYYNGDIIRNHLYKIKIDNVSEEGASSASDAYDEVNAKVQASVTTWNIIKTGTIIDGQYNLYVDRPGIIIPPEGSVEYVTATTDHPEGITITDVSSWIGNVSGGNDGDKVRRIRIESGAYNGPSRNGNITVKAGNMNYVIKVVQ